MSRVTKYTIIEGEDIKAMIDSAVDMLTYGWQPLGGAMPNNYREDVPDGYGGNYTVNYCTYSQTWVKMEE